MTINAVCPGMDVDPRLTVILHSARKHTIHKSHRITNSGHIKSVRSKQGCADLNLSTLLENRRPLLIITFRFITHIIVSSAH